MNFKIMYIQLFEGNSSMQLQQPIKTIQWKWNSFLEFVMWKKIKKETKVTHSPMHKMLSKQDANSQRDSEFRLKIYEH